MEIAFYYLFAKHRALFYLLIAAMLYVVLIDLPASRSFSGVGSFRSAADDRTVTIGVRDCRAYIKERWLWLIPSWQEALDPPSYAFGLWPSDCTGQHVEGRGDYVYVRLCRTPIGAGSGCGSSSGNFVSYDGRTWRETR